LALLAQRSDEDGRIASERLADLEAGRATALSADEVKRALER
jgi:hypothetical protein